MPFCTTCGEELTPDMKFCESCGAPVEQVPQAQEPVSPEQPVRQPLVPPPPPAKPLPLLPIIGIIVALSVIVAGVYFVGLPYLQKNTGTDDATPIPTPVVPMYTPESVMPEETLSLPPTPTPTVRKLAGRYEEYYDEIYTLNQPFANGQKVYFSHDLTTPPLYIQYNLTPRLKTREQVINIGMSSEQTISTSYPDPNAWFAIRVLDAANGAVIKEQGYGKEYPDVARDEFMVRNAGNYKVEMSGNAVTAEITILKGKSS